MWKVSEPLSVTGEVKDWHGHSPERLKEMKDPYSGSRKGASSTLTTEWRTDDLFRLPSAVRRDPRIEAWFDEITDPFRSIVRPRFERIRNCGPDVRELLHDGCPVACVGDAAFAYVNAFAAHAAIGFFHGASLADPAGLLEGDGTRMRHLKFRPGSDVDDDVVNALIVAAYEDMRRRLAKPEFEGP